MPERIRFAKCATFCQLEIADFVVSLTNIKLALEGHGDQLHAEIAQDVADELEVRLAQPGP